VFFFWHTSCSTNKQEVGVCSGWLCKKKYTVWLQTTVKIVITKVLKKSPIKM
jgi:hypothetical protein